MFEFLYGEILNKECEIQQLFVLRTFLLLLKVWNVEMMNF